MTTSTITPLRLQTVKTSELFSRVADIWTRRSLDLTAYCCENLGSQIQITIDDGAELPRFLYIGPNSSMTKFFGKDFARTAAGKRETPDKRYSQSIKGRYREVACAQKPAFDQIRSRIGNQFLAYNRLIVPVDVYNFGPGFAIFTEVFRTFHVVGQKPSQNDFSQLNQLNGSV